MATNYQYLVGSFFMRKNRRLERGRMREIKFRAWENLENRMCTNVQNGVYEDPDEYIDFGRILGYARFDVMQYTGLKDKNGVEIYEGDIVLFTDNIRINGTTSHISVVEWLNELTGFHFKADCIGYYQVNHSQVNKYDVEVIGNIYENPELVTEVN